MNTITIYTETENLVNKMALISQLEKLNNVEQVNTLKSHYETFKIYLTNKHNDRVAFNINFSTLSLLTIFVGGNLLVD
jgi:hypothetical protein